MAMTLFWAVGSVCSHVCVNPKRWYLLRSPYEVAYNPEEKHRQFCLQMLMNYFNLSVPGPRRRATYISTCPSVPVLGSSEMRAV